jgi:sugar phosphate isomerase/epimerase
MAQTKKSPPRVVLFLAQPFGTLVGPNKNFANLSELCRWAHEECGFEGVSAPAASDFVDIGQVIESPAYRDDIRGFYDKLGTPLTRLEMHVVGQRMLMHPATAVRYAMFGPSELAKADFRAQEDAAAKEALNIVEACGLLGFKHLVNFPGNRGWTAAKYPWSAYPKNWRRTILKLVLLKHYSVLKRCAELGIKMGFELHPEEDLESPLLLYYLRELAKQVAPEVVPAIYANADASHPTLAGNDAARHFLFLEEQSLLGMCHLKDGERGDSFLDNESLEYKGGSVRGDFAPEWSKSNRRFCTFGTGDANWQRIIPCLHRVHQNQDEGLDFVVEAECSKFPNMLQGIKIGAENARRARDKKPLLCVQNITPEPCDNGNWEAFCTSPLPAEDLLKMDDGERAAIAAWDAKFDPEAIPGI